MAPNDPKRLGWCASHKPDATCILCETTSESSRKSDSSDSSSPHIPGRDIREAYTETLMEVRSNKAEEPPKSSSSVRPDDEQFSIESLAQRANKAMKARQAKVAKKQKAKTKYEILAVGVKARNNLVFLQQKNDENPRWLTKSACSRTVASAREELQVQWAANQRCTVWAKFPGLKTCAWDEDEDDSEWMECDCGTMYHLRCYDLHPRLPRETLRNWRCPVCKRVESGVQQALQQ